MHETYDYMWWPMENQWVNLPNKTFVSPTRMKSEGTNVVRTYASPVLKP